MNRDKIMTLAKKSLRFLPDKSYIKLYYRLRVGRKLDTDNPTTLNEKLQWMKFNYRFPLQSIVSDKLLVRNLKLFFARVMILSLLMLKFLLYSFQYYL